MLDTQIIELPSGIECEIQELTAEAERVLTNKTDLKSGQWINKFMAKAIVRIGDKKYENQGELISALLDMKTGDRNYLLVKIRQQSYGDEIEFNFECPKCHKVSAYGLNLQEMLDSGKLKVYPYWKDTPILVETREGVAEVDYMTGHSEQWLASIKEMETIHLAMAACKSFNGHPPEYKDFLKLPVRDLAKIRATYSKLKGGLDARLKLDCDECNSENEVTLYQITDFFIPSTTLDNIGL